VGVFSSATGLSEWKEGFAVPQHGLSEWKEWFAVSQHGLTALFYYKYCPKAGFESFLK
jgi:hypothetical protein